jgi:hypothetical protein
VSLHCTCPNDNNVVDNLAAVVQLAGSWFWPGAKILRGGQMLATRTRVGSLCVRLSGGCVRLLRTRSFHNFTATKGREIIEERENPLNLYIKACSSTLRLVRFTINLTYAFVFCLTRRTCCPAGVGLAPNTDCNASKLCCAEHAPCGLDWIGQSPTLDQHYLGLHDSWLGVFRCSSLRDICFVLKQRKPYYFFFFFSLKKESLYIGRIM